MIANFLAVLLTVASSFVFAEAQHEEYDFSKDWQTVKQLYNDGQYEEACARYAIMSASGIAEGAHALGHCYLDGKAMPQSFKKAAKYFECAALQGYVRSQLALAFMMLEDKVSKKEFRHPYFWLSLAASNSNETPEVRAAAAMMRDEASRTVKATELQELQSLASKWKPLPKSGCRFE
jgi:TPR repeat protein